MPLRWASSAYTNKTHHRKNPSSHHLTINHRHLRQPPPQEEEIDHVQFGCAVKLRVLASGGFQGCIASLWASLALYWCFIYELRHTALWPSFLGWFLVLTGASQFSIGLYLTPLPLWMLLLPQLIRLNRRFGHDRAPLPAGVANAGLVEWLDLRWWCCGLAPPLRRCSLVGGGAFRGCLQTLDSPCLQLWLRGCDVLFLSKDGQY
jgi:hypothetical protein